MPEDDGSVFWLNGYRVHRNSIDGLNRGLHYGDGLFETMMVVNQRIPLWERHKHRLLTDAHRLALPIDEQSVQQDVDCIIASLDDLPTHLNRSFRLKYLLMAGGRGPLGYTRPRANCDRLMILQPMVTNLDHERKYGVKAQLCQWRLSHQPQLAGIKHLNRLDQIMAAKELTDAFEGITCDQHGNIIEGISSNVFAVLADGQLVTPLLNNAGVAGVMRGLIMDVLAPSLGVMCQEIRMTSLTPYHSMFLTNAVWGIVPITMLNHKTLAIHDVIKQLQRCYQQWMDSP